MKSSFAKSLFSPFPTILSQDAIILWFRILVSLSMIHTHGLKKIIHFADTIKNIPDPFGLGGEISTYIALLANIVSPVLVILGLGTRIAALQILSVTLMGFFVVHAADPWTLKDVPLMYSLAYLLILSYGAGRYSLDDQIFRKR